MILFYTGFMSYEILLIFFEFLGPSVSELHYWGTREGPHKRKRATKLAPLNQFFSYTSESKNERPSFWIRLECWSDITIHHYMDIVYVPAFKRNQLHANHRASC